MRRIHLAFLLAISGAAIAEVPDSLGPIKDFQVLTPRPFGYTIGDVIRETLIISVDREAVLDRNSLPRSRINRWLELREANVVESESDGLRRYRIELAYQSFYAPLEVKNLAIPAFKLVFNSVGQSGVPKDSESAEGSFHLDVPAWRFTMAPIRELSVLREEGLEPMRPDAPPRLPGRSGPIRGLAAAGVVGFGAGLYLAYLHGYLPWRRRGRHFGAACRTVRALSRAGGGADYSAAYAAIHHAFNGVYGQPLFSEQLDEFFLERPAYEPMRAEIKAFFVSSYEFFFGQEPKETGFPMSRLFRLCRDCYDIERNLR